MTVAPPADPRDVQDFQFKLHCRLRIFTGQDETFNNSINLVVPASKYGLIFVGCPTGIQAINSSSISGLELRSGEISSYPRRELNLPSRPTHLGVSCDQNYLIVAITKDSCAHGLIYSVPSFTAKNVALLSEIRLSSKPDTSILELTWNPGIANILATCLADGSLAAYELKPTGLDISTQPPATQATCFCWSPKGKQLVVGTEVGTLTQYKPDLKSVKTIPAPNIGSGSVAVVNVLWISNYQFAAIYRDKLNADERPGLLIVNAPKAAAVTFVNYEDICYSAGELRSPQFYIIHQPAWNILMVASANSMEVGVLGLQEDQISWEQWTQEDAARAELPLTSDKQETFPVGMGLDTSPQNELSWGENQSLPPMPILHILSHQGVLCLFHVVNLKPDAVCICTPPEKLPDGLAFFTTPSTLPAEAKLEGSIQASPIQSSRTQTSTDSGLGSLRINLAPKFDGVNTSQPPAASVAAAPNLFGQVSNVIGTAAPFGSGFTAPSLHFGSGLASTTSSALGSGLSSTTASTSASTSFVTAVTGFGSGISNPTSTATSAPSMSTFGGGTTNPTSVNFGTDPGLVLSVGQSNSPSISFGTGLNFSGSSIPTTKPAFSFPVATTTTAPALPLSSKPSTIQSGTSFTLLAPGATSTPQQSPKPSQQLQTTGAAKPQISFFSPGTSDQSQGGAVNLTKIPTKAAEVQTLEVKQSQVKPAAPVTKSAASLPAVSTAVLINAVNEEITHFERELAELRSRVTAVKVEVGSEEEKFTLCQKVDSIDEFWRELKETTQAQTSEIHVLKSELLEAFAWTEEAKSRTRQLNNPMYLQLSRSQTLDPITARYASNIKHLVYYVENQLRQVNQQLDSDWLDFQESCKPPIKNKLHIPTLEAVYQAMVMQNSILNKQRVIMADVARRAQGQGRSTQIPLISTAVLARVRDKEASHLGKGETELARLAENLVQLKLGPPSMHINHQSRCLSRKKELLLRELLSQRTVTRICPTKPLQSMLGGISTGKPILTKIDTPSDTLITETSKAVEEVDKNESLGTRGFSLISGKTSGPAVSVLSNSLTRDVNKVKPNTIADNLSIPKPSVNEVSNNGPPAGHITFNNPLQSGKTAVPENFSFTTGLPYVGKLSSASKKLEDYYEEITPPGTPDHTFKEPNTSLPVVSTPSTTATFSFTPAKPNILPPSSTGNTSISLQRSPLSSLDNIVAGIGDGSISIKPVNKTADNKAPSTLSQGNTGTSGAVSFGSLSLGQKGKSEEIKKPADTFKFSLTSTFATAPATLASSGSGDNLQMAPLKVPVATTAAGIVLQTPVFVKTPVFTSFGTENQQAYPTPKLSIFGGSGESLKLPASTGNNASSSSSGNIFAEATTSIFGGINTGSPAKQPLSSGNIFGASTTTPSLMFGKHMIETIVTGTATTTTTTSATTTTSSSSAVTTTVTTESEQKTAESPQKDKTRTSSSNDTLFSQSTTLFGSLSVGTAGSAVKPVGNIFGGSSTTFSFGNQSASSENKTPNFSFGKQSTSSENKIPSFSFGKQLNLTENQSADFGFGKQPAISSENQPNLAEGSIPEVTDTQSEKSESPAKDTQPSSTKPSITSIFGQPPSKTSDEKAETSETSSTLSTGTVLSTEKVENTAGSTFSLDKSSTTTVSNVASPKPTVFGQPSGDVKTLPGSIFDTAATMTATTQNTTSTVTSPVTSATQTSSAASSNFTFSLPASTQSSSPFAQKTSVFGQPDSTSSTTTATTTSTTFFGQPICSPSGFGQSGGSIFGQTATTAAKTNIFGQVASTTSTPAAFGQASAASTSQSIFGQTSSTPLFGQASTGSSFLGGNTGGFGSKSTFGQSGGSVFGQAGSSTFGSGGGSIFGGSGSGGGTAGASVFGGGTGSPSGNLFQSSSGGSIFGGGTSSSSTGSGGAFSSGVGQTISQSGFGSPTAFQSKPGAFGGSPVFDRGAPGFGAPPTFGGAPTFGGSPTFGSPGKVFGSSSPASNISFGSTGQQQSSTFESLANQNTMSFGNIAQNQGQAFGSSTQSVFGGSPQSQSTSTPSFSSNNAFGGSSFSSWR